MVSTIKRKTQKDEGTKILWQDQFITEHFKPTETDKTRFECVDCSKENNPFQTKNQKIFSPDKQVINICKH